MTVPVGITVTVVITQEVVLLAYGIVGNLQRLVDGGKKTLSQVRNEVNKTSEVILDVRRWQAAHEVESAVKLLLGAVRHV